MGGVNTAQSSAARWSVVGQGVSRWGVARFSLAKHSFHSPHRKKQGYDGVLLTRNTKSVPQYVFYAALLS